MTLRATMLVLLVAVTALALSSVDALTSCTTPSGQSGQCISKQSCEPVSKLLRAGQSHGQSPSYKQLYGSTACDAAGLYEEKICCPLSNNEQSEESDEDSDEVSERRRGRRPRPRPTTRRPTDSDRDEDYRPGQFGNNDYTTRRPSRYPSSNNDRDNDYTTRRPSRDPFGNNDYTTRRPSRNPFGNSDRDNDYTTRRPSRYPSSNNDRDIDYTTRRPSRDPFGNNDYTTRRPSGAFGSGSFGSGNDYTTRRPIGSGSFGSDLLGSSSDYTTRRPSGSGNFGSSNFASGSDYTTRRPLRDRTTRRPSTSSGGSSSTLVNPDTCGPINQDRIVGGNQTVVFELPWMARLGYGSRGRSVSYRCGGSLINHRYVLTAAHCVGGSDNPTQVRLGEFDAESTEDCSQVGGQRVCAPPVVDVEVEDVIPHPDFSDDSSSPNYLKNDICLLRLRTPVQFTDAVRPICLPAGGSDGATGKKVAVAGWGKDKNRGSSGTRFLMKASLPMTPFSQCNRVYQQRGISLEESSQICAGGERGVDSCQGDSGGPLYRAGGSGGPRMTQVGVVSFGLQNCAVEGVPGVYTNVEHFMPWITRTMRP